ncbi:PREDICTED: uncharacterized protein LOC104822461 isoform X2 [Tarenaya hassleriana]|nr:PREDICTED: uncharacterized protein LOC104822461 isoform X2 [Tarenaya hassleriana]
MGDHLVLEVDRLDAGLGTLNRSKEPSLARVNEDRSTESVFGRAGSYQNRLVQCRICHDEDEDSNMETPCSCSGSLKFAHRKCIQRWCNEKGDTVCEICLQQFKHGYTAPRKPFFHYAGISTNFGEGWGMEGLNLHNSNFIPWSAFDHDFLNPDDDELYSVHSPHSIICCRVIALLFILLLFLRHFLPVILTGTDDFSLTVFTLLILRTVGIFLLAYLFVKAFTFLCCHRNRRDLGFSGFTSEEETEPSQMSVPELRAVPVN